MDPEDPWYWAGIATGFFGGIALFLTACPWDACVLRGIQLGQPSAPTLHVTR